MSASHTPAPWRTSLCDDTVVIHIDAKGVHHEVASIDGDYNEPDLWPIMEANARLIAAAPDLLVACQAVLDEFPALDGKRIERIKAVCRAAIARTQVSA